MSRPLSMSPDPDACLHPLDERPVLGADLGVEGERLLDPRLVGVRRDEVVEKAVRPLGCQRDDRADREVGSTGHDVDRRCRERAGGTGRARPRRSGRTTPRGSGRGGPCCVMRQVAGLEQVRVGRHVDHRGEPRMGDRAVVALEEVLGADLPVRVELGLRAREEAKRIEIDSGAAMRSGTSPRNPRAAARRGPDSRTRAAPTCRAAAGPARARRRRSLLLARTSVRREPAVEAVRPRVVRTLDRLALTGSLADDRSPVAADVEERAELSFPVANEDDGDVPDAGRVNEPGSATSLARPTYCHERRKMRSCSSWSTAGSAYQLHGSVRCLRALTRGTLATVRRHACESRSEAAEVNRSRRTQVVDHSGLVVPRSARASSSPRGARACGSRRDATAGSPASATQPKSCDAVEELEAVASARSAGVARRTAS